jgi:uncharacterized protein YjbI with pentapeptide repeats
MSGRLWSLLVFSIVAAFPGKSNLVYANLIGADLSGKHLQDANLSGKDLSGADLKTPIWRALT